MLVCGTEKSGLAGGVADIASTGWIARTGDHAGEKCAAVRDNEFRSKERRAKESYPTLSRPKSRNGNISLLTFERP